MTDWDAFGISFFDLPKASPKSAKTKRACQEVVRYLLERNELLEGLRTKKRLPVSQLMAEPRINDKILDRYRKYIIAGVLIRSSGYTVLPEYFCL